jgi:hypothetical protein
MHEAGHASSRGREQQRRRLLLARLAVYVTSARLVFRGRNYAAGR